MLYCFAIVLDFMFRLQRLCNILKVIDKNMNLDYVGTYFNIVSQRFTKVFKAYKEESKMEETQSPVYVPVYTFESPVKRNWLKYEDDAREAAVEANRHNTLSGSQSDEFETYLNTRIVLPSEEIETLRTLSFVDNEIRATSFRGLCVLGRPTPAVCFAIRQTRMVFSHQLTKSLARGALVKGGS